MQELLPKIIEELLDHRQIGVTLDIYSYVIPSCKGGTMQKLHGLFALLAVGEGE